MCDCKKTVVICECCEEKKEAEIESSVLAALVGVPMALVGGLVLGPIGFAAGAAATCAIEATGDNKSKEEK